MRKSIHPAISMVLVALLVAACGQRTRSPDATAPASSPASPTKPPAAAKSQLTSTLWFLSSYLDASGNMSSVISESQVTAEFNNGQAGGSAGCNSYSGPYEVDGSRLSFGQFFSTMMACEEPLMQQESAFMAALAKTASYQIAGGQLSLLDSQGVVLLIFSADQPAASAP